MNKKNIKDTALMLVIIIVVVSLLRLLESGEYKDTSAEVTAQEYQEIFTKAKESKEFDKHLKALGYLEDNKLTYEEYETLVEYYKQALVLDYLGAKDA